MIRFAFFSRFRVVRAPVGISLVSSQATPPSLSKRTAPSAPGKPTTGRFFVLRHSMNKIQHTQYHSVHWVHIVTICDHVFVTHQFKQCCGPRHPVASCEAKRVILKSRRASQSARRQRNSGALGTRFYVPLPCATGCSVEYCRVRCSLCR